MNVYFISGLGADERAFAYLHLPTHFTAIHLQWLTPEKNETLPQYAMRMASDIDASQPFILIGLSYGGMLAIEISKQLTPVKTILLSSAATTSQLPFLYRCCGWLQMDKLLPRYTYNKNLRLLDWIFGPHNEASLRLLHLFIKEGDPVFIKRALGQIIRWKNTTKPPNLVQMHGMNDMLLPLVKGEGIIPIPGGHLCLITHATILNAALEKELIQL